jgi:SAM-dependent methyltransferase
MEVVTIFSGSLGGYKQLLLDRAGFASYFASVMEKDERLRGRVLDVGCGEHGTTMVANGRNVFQNVLARPSRLDGVDPSEGVLKNAHIVSKYHGLLEKVDLPAATYDAIISFFVLEHVGAPSEFLRAGFATLRPGGVFYAITPHAHHPFAVCTRLLDVLGLKGKVAGTIGAEGANPYPTYSRLNSRRSVVRACENVGFQRATFYLAPCAQWDTYFPRSLRWIPHLYDWTIGSRFGPFAQQLMVKLEKPA